jgi:hypothetical protein
MADDRKVYSDKEFALILRKAAELATSRPESPHASPTGLTLAEMKSAAAQAGLDPALVERAARMLAETGTDSPLERLTGGPLRHNREASFPVRLDEEGAALLLSAIRINSGLAGSRDVGHSSPMGMSWHDGGELESLSVTARPGEDGTAVSVALDRRGTLGVVAAGTGFATFFTVLFAVYGLYPDAPALGIGGFIAGMGGIAAVARGYWAASTRKVRERINGVMDTVEQTLRQPESEVPRPRAIGDGAAPPAPVASMDGSERSAP